MPLDVEGARITYSADTADLASAKGHLESLEKAGQELDAQLKRGEITIDEFNESMSHVEATAARIVQSLIDLANAEKQAAEETKLWAGVSKIEAEEAAAAQQKLLEERLHQAELMEIQLKHEVEMERWAAQQKIQEEEAWAGVAKIEAEEVAKAQAELAAERQHQADMATITLKHEMAVMEQQATAAQKLGASIDGVSKANQLLERSTKLEKIQELNAALKEQVYAYQVAVDAARKKGMTDAQIITATKAQADAIIATNKQLTAMGTGFGNARMASMQLAFAIQDATSVGMDFGRIMMAISNNAQMMAMYTGMSAKALIGLTVGVAIVQSLAGQWDNIVKKVKEFLNLSDPLDKTLEKMKERLQDMEKIKVKLGPDQLEMESLKEQIKMIEEAQRRMEQIRTGRTEVEQKAGEAVHKTMAAPIEEGGGMIGGEDFANRLKAAAIKRAEQFDDTFTQAQNAANKELEALAKQREATIAAGGPAAGAQLARIEAREKEIRERLATARKEMNERAEQQVGADIQAAEREGGARQREAAKRLEALLRSMGLETMANDVAAFTQDNVRSMEELQKRTKAAEGQRAALKRDQEKIAKQGQLEADAETETIEKQQKVAVDALKRREDLAHHAAQIYASLLKQGMTEADAIEETQRRIYEYLKGAVARRGAAPTGRLITEEARRLAEGAPAVAGQRVAAGQKAGEEAGAEVGRRQAKLQEVLGQQTIAQIEDQILGIKQMRGITPQQRKVMLDELAARWQATARQKLVESGLQPQEAVNVARELVGMINAMVNDLVGRTAAMLQNQFAEMARQGLQVPAFNPQQAQQVVLQQARQQLAPQLPPPPALAAPAGPAPMPEAPAGGGMRSVAPEAPQDRILGAVERMGGVVAQGQGSTGAIVGRLGRLESFVQQLASNGGMVARATQEHQPPALNFGANTA